MFGKKIQSDKIHTIIGTETTLEGVLSSKSTLRIDGKIIGEVKSEGHIIIGKTGEIHGDIHSKSLTIEGTAEGNMFIQERVQLASTSHLTGDIHAASIEIEQGAIFNGRSTMQAAPSKTTVLATVEPLQQ